MTFADLFAPGFAVPGGIELMVLLLIVVLLFGAKRVPKLARASGQALGEFHIGREKAEKELQDELGDVSNDDVGGAT